MDAQVRRSTLDTTAICADIRALLATNIFSSSEADGPLFKAAYVWLILCLNDLLQDAVKSGMAIQPAFAGDTDVVALVQSARYAIVHNAGGAKRRRSTTDFPAGDYEVAVGAASGHDDDIAVTLAGVRVLLRRHAIDAFELVQGMDRNPV